VTLCVAGIFYMDGRGGVVAASDRMVTSGDVSFEPNKEKILSLTEGMSYGKTNEIYLLISGDIATQTEICQRVRLDVRQILASQPDSRFHVVEVARLYGLYYDEFRMWEASKAILSPFGLDTESFISRQKDMAPSLVSEISRELLNYDSPSLQLETLVVGVDASGPHIFHIKNGRVSCQDHIGFASIGIGEYHANSQLMLSGFSHKCDVAEASFLIYTAKKRAEVAPGVGPATDMVVIGPELGFSALMPSELLDPLEKIYNDLFKIERDALREAQNRIRNDYYEISQRAIAQSEQVGSGGRHLPSTDEESDRVSAPNGQPISPNTGEQDNQ
jgi:20S proteasome alpha/beta subunit